MMRVAWGLLFSCMLIGSAVCVSEADAVAVDRDCLVSEDSSSSACHIELLQVKAQALGTAKGSSADLGNETATCMVWGPSHVHVFDEKEVTWMSYLMSFFRTPSIESDLDVTEVGDFWLVNSPYVKIQGRYNVDSDSKEPFLRAVTVGGKFLEDNTITVGTANHKALWNDEEILTQTPSSFSVDHLVKAKYSLKVPHVHEPSKSGPGILMELPMGINLVVNRGNKSLELGITMPKVPENLGGQDGQCGNFNGDNEDDTAESIDGRMTLKVPDEALLLKYPFKSIKDSLKKIHEHKSPKHSSDETGPKFTAIHSSTSSEATCTVWGDPHITVFDNRFNALEPRHLSLSQGAVVAESLEEIDATPVADINAFELGDTWLVKSSKVKIQGRYNVVASSNYKKPFLRAVAIGGSFLQNNSLVIGMNSTLWNDQEILPKPHTSFSVKNLISASYDAHTPLVQDKRRVSPGVDLKLPLGVKLLVNRHKNGLGLAITMPKVEGGQEGQCGNYNGQKADDTAELISGRLGNAEIPFQEVLFRNVFHLAQAKKATNEAHNVDEALLQVDAQKDSKPTCTLWGRGHTAVFDKAELSWAQYLMSFFVAASIHSDIDGTELGDFWLVKSNSVKIQGRYNVPHGLKDKAPFLRSFVAGGSFIENNTLTVSTVDRKVYWNDMEILSDAETFEQKGLVKASFTDAKSSHGSLSASRPVKIEFTKGVDLLVTRHGYGLELEISMRNPDGGEVDGQCGNMNGNHKDDTADLIESRMNLRVASDELLYKNPFDN